MTPLKLTLTALLIALAVPVPVPALASDDDRQGHRERDRDGYNKSDWGHDRSAATDRTDWLTREAIAQKLAEGGLKAERIKADDGRYEVYATDPMGARVKIYVDPTTGAIIGRDRGNRG